MIVYTEPSYNGAERAVLTLGTVKYKSTFVLTTCEFTWGTER